MTLVVDASVAVQLGVTEASSDRARAVVARGERMIAPDLIVAEVASALWKKETRGDLDATERAVAFAASIGAYEELVPCRDLAARTLELAVALRHPVYDCFYLALAEARDATFITEDARLLTRLAQGGWTGRFEAL